MYYANLPISFCNLNMMLNKLTLVSYLFDSHPGHKNDLEHSEHVRHAEGTRYRAARCGSNTICLGISSGRRGRRQDSIRKIGAGPFVRYTKLIGS